MHAADTTAFWYLPAWSLCRREILRFLRQRSRVIGALGTPVVFWVLIGSGIGKSFMYAQGGAARGMNYLEYSYPGMMVLIVLFTAIFSMISVIEDRREGFLQAVLAAPVARSSIVVGKLLGSSALAVAQGLLFLCLAPLAGVPLTLSSFFVTIFVLVLLAVELGALGFVVACPMDSTQGFHAVMNLFLIPMWLLSGAMFPASGALPWLAWVMAVNPLTYGVTALRHALYLSGESAGMPSFAVSIVVTAVFAAGMVAFAARLVESRG